MTAIRDLLRQISLVCVGTLVVAAEADEFIETGRSFSRCRQCLTIECTFEIDAVGGQTTRRGSGNFIDVGEMMLLDERVDLWKPAVVYWDVGSATMAEFAREAIIRQPAEAASRSTSESVGSRMSSTPSASLLHEASMTSG